MNPLLHAPCGYFAFGDDRIIREVNLEAARMLGAEREQLLGRAVSEVLTTRTRVFFTAQVYPALTLHGAVHETYVSLRKVNGDEIATLMNIVRRKQDGDWLNESVFMAMQRRRLFEKDLIEQRRVALSAAHAELEAIEQLKAAQSKLAAQEQLASLGMLAAGVAQEINNPLSYVAGNLELLHKRLQDRFDDNELHGMLTEATQGLQRIRDIVRSLRTLSRMEEAAAPAAQQPAAATPTEPEERARPRLLLIDDDQHVTRMIARALRAFEVTVVNHSQDALGLLAAASFDVILCDLMMPNVSGIDIHRELARCNPGLAQRMIFLTGGGFSAEAEGFLAQVENPCIQKPFATEALQQACSEMARKHAGVHTSGIKLRSQS